MNQMNDRQSDVRELLASVREEQDRTIEEGLAGSLGHDDDVIVAVLLAIREMDPDPDRPVTTTDLIWAGAFLDHLDTQNFRVKPKKSKKWHAPDGHNRGKGKHEQR